MEPISFAPMKSINTKLGFAQAESNVLASYMTSFAGVRQPHLDIAYGFF
jgi:hypothetical protein